MPEEQSYDSTVISLGDFEATPLSLQMVSFDTALSHLQEFVNNVPSKLSADEIYQMLLFVCYRASSLIHCSTFDDK